MPCRFATNSPRLFWPRIGAVGTGWSVKLWTIWCRGAMLQCIKKHRDRPFKNEANANICQPARYPKMMNTSKNGYGSRPLMPYLDLFGVDLFMHFAAILGWTLNTEHWGPCPNIPTHPMCPIWSVPLFLAPWDPESLSYWIPSWPHADARCDGVLTGGSLKRQW